MFEDLAVDRFYEFPSFEVALFSILLSFVLSSAISFTYHLTNQGTLSRNFVQAMMLSSIVTCMVIMAVGNNIAAGFGIMGAIAIVRFRLRVENPRKHYFHLCRVICRYSCRSLWLFNCHCGYYSILPDRIFALHLSLWVEIARQRI